MLEPSTPHDEADRLAELGGIRLLDTPKEERFDRITRTAQRVFNVPTALITLVDTGRQWFKSRQGMDMPETPRRISLCGHAILSDDALIVNDASLDARFSDNPLVVGDMHLRFYAGIPLRSENGFRIGTLCLIDKIPREFSDADLLALRDMAGWAELELNVYSITYATALSKEKESRLRAIVDHAGDGIITIDDYGTIETFNPAAARMFNYLPAQVIGEHVSMLLTKPYRAEVGTYLKKFSDSRGSQIPDTSLRVHGQRENGTNFPADLMVSEMVLHGRRGFTGIVRDISDRRRAEQHVRALNRELATTTGLQQAILNSTNYSIISTNVNGTIRMFNHGAQRMLGYSETDVVDKESLAFFNIPEELEAHAHILSHDFGRRIEPGFDVLVAQARGVVTEEMEWTYRRKDGTTLPVMLSVAALWDEKKLSGYAAIAFDLTERKRMESMKSEFISTVSHELRTPLTSIRGSLGLLAGGAAGEFPSRAKVLLDIANNNCERLVRLINDILDIEKVESGNMRFDMVRQRILPLVEQAISATQAFATQYQVKLELQPDADDAKASVDADRLIQVIVNLLSNAAKFSPLGATVEVRLIKLGDYLRLAVTDRGEGISDEFKSRIFQKFAQADSSDTRQKGGTGLGLSISRTIVEKHGGRIDFQSQRGIGTTFFFDLPIAASPISAPAPTSTPLPA